jgi:hypothetical protein
MAGEQHHQADRGDHRRDHHGDLADHADGGDDGIEGENQIDDDDLGDDAGKAGGHLARFALLAFEQLVDLAGALPDQEQAAGIRIRSRPEMPVRTA